MLSLLVPIYKRESDHLNTNSYRSIKLLEHVFKLHGRYLDKRLGEIVDMDKVQYGFTPGRGTVDAVFIFRTLTKKYCSKSKKLFYILFVDLEKAFSRVLQKVICYALRKNDVSEYLFEGLMSLYSDFKTAFSVDGELSNKFSFLPKLGFIKVQY